MLLLLPCDSCKGSGTLGSTGQATIVCPDCEGVGLDIAERMCVLDGRAV